MGTLVFQQQLISSIKMLKINIHSSKSLEIDGYKFEVLYVRVGQEFFQHHLDKKKTIKLKLIETKDIFQNQINLDKYSRNFVLLQNVWFQPRNLSSVFDFMRNDVTFFKSSKKGPPEVCNESDYCEMDY